MIILLRILGVFVVWFLMGVLIAILVERSEKSRGRYPSGDMEIACIILLGPIGLITAVIVALGPYAKKGADLTFVRAWEALLRFIRWTAGTEDRY